MPATPARIAIGSAPWSEPSSSSLANATCRAFQYVPRRLSNVLLQTLTAPWEAAIRWITTCHRFNNRVEFLYACQIAGWTCPPGQGPELPQGVAVDIVGPIVPPAQVGEGGVPVAGEVIDPRYHVNLAWQVRDPEAAFQASLLVPATPSRGWDVPTVPEARPPVLPIIPAWKGKAALREAGLLDAVEAAVAAAGGRIQEACTGAAEWSRDSRFIGILAKALDLEANEVDDMFRDADAIKS